MWDLILFAVIASVSHGTAAVGPGLEERSVKPVLSAAVQSDVSLPDSLGTTAWPHSGVDGDSLPQAHASPYARGYLEGYREGYKKASSHRTLKASASCGCGGCLGLFMNIPGLIVALFMD
jgi:hypothetical protein